jgi:putative flippase GtrA
MFWNFYYRFIQELSIRLPGFYRLLFRHRKVTKFLISGGTAAFVDLVILYFLTDILGWWYLLSAVIAFLVAFGVSFNLQKRWTFRDYSDDRFFRQLVLYLSFSLFVNLILNTFLLYLFVDFLGVWYLLSQVIVSLLIAVLSFFVYGKLIFKVRSPVQQL